MFGAPTAGDSGVFRDFPTLDVGGEGEYLKAGGKYFALAAKKTPKLFIKDITDYGNMGGNDAGYIELDCMTSNGRITDFDFNPFDDDIIALGDTDGKIAIAKIPENGIEIKQTVMTKKIL